MTRRLITDKALWDLHQAQDRIKELCDWVRANGLSPEDVAAEEPLTIEDAPDGRVIRCHVFVTNEDGVKVRPQDGGPHTEERTVPLAVEPPDGWPVYALADNPGRIAP